MTQEFVTLPREVVEQVFYHLIRGDADAVCWADGVIKPALEQPQRKLTPQDIADSALLGNIESPFNACMHQEHCKRWKAQADKQHHGELSSDNDLQCENSHLITTSSSVPFGYKLVPMEPTEEMLRAGCGSESPAMFRESLRRETDGQKTVEMVEKIIQRNLNSYRAMLDAAPQPPALEQQVEQESTCKDSLQGEQAAVAWLATYTGKVGEPLVYVTSSYELAVENDRNQSPKPLHLHQQNLNCKSNQKRLATLWGYVKAEQPQVQQEPSPVAKIIGMDEEYGPMLLWHRAWADFPVGTKIYTHSQPKREPLTDEQIDACFPVQWEGDFYQPWRKTVARAIEAAHNIK